MDRRQAVRAGLLGSGAVLLGTDLSAEVSQSAHRVPQRKIKFHTHEVMDNRVADNATGTENWGHIGRGLHAREFSVPKGTHLILGHVQEAGNYGEAKYRTLGISINRSVWRCRVIWKMDWDLAGTLLTHFHWIRF